jgi:hypothetical protein
MLGCPVFTPRRADSERSARDLCSTRDRGEPVAPTRCGRSQACWRYVRDPDPGWLGRNCHARAAQVVVEKSPPVIGTMVGVFDDARHSWHRSMNPVESVGTRVGSALKSLGADGTSVEARAATTADKIRIWPQSLQRLCFRPKLPGMLQRTLEDLACAAGVLHGPGCVQAHALTPRPPPCRSCAG